jgi:hypothetical protein
MAKIINFEPHPSEELQRLYRKRTFQMQIPEKARIIFLGRDANWDKDIDQNECFFNEVKKYLKDGVKYWQKKYIHSPMLIPCYKGEGKRYHTQFCKLEFTYKNAEDICFLELLNYCTCGTSSKNDKIFKEKVSANANKKQRDKIIDLSKKKNIKICIPDGVISIIDELGLFPTNGKNIITHKHFSDAISDEDLQNLKNELHKFLKGK